MRKCAFRKIINLSLLIAAMILMAMISSISRSYSASMWQPPKGMVWQLPGNGCAPKSESFAIIQGCYFGNDTEQHAGAAFFRVCAKVRELQPFLIVDYIHGGYIFRLENDRPEAGYFDPVNDGVDPVPFYARVRERLGECWYGSDDPT